MIAFALARPAKPCNILKNCRHCLLADYVID
ncbi:hypothetical protein GOY19_04495 [Aeromonas hydrophila]|nr:hypothetical protein C1A23_13305 [Aeromonas hydrophila subsp. hydrophila]MBQ4677039.1 hypothetical protein [Aeromonas hydrophila]MBW3813642.1 hypothetical protein [Aeromonas hydrophila]